MTLLTTPRHAVPAPALALALLLVAPAAVLAGEQAVGVGARLSLVRGETSVDGTGADRFAGGFLRLRPSPRTALELALDYRSHLNEDLTRRIKDMPLQASLLLYPVRAAIAPYLLGGVGWYSQKAIALDGGQEIAAETLRTFGYHAGFGGELQLGGHVAVHADYRYTFIRFGSDEPDTGESAGIPLLSTLQDNLRLSHKGSMWTAGIALYF